MSHQRRSRPLAAPIEHSAPELRLLKMKAEMRAKPDASGGGRCGAASDTHHYVRRLPARDGVINLRALSPLWSNTTDPRCDATDGPNGAIRAGARGCRLTCRSNAVRGGDPPSSHGLVAGAATRNRPTYPERIDALRQPCVEPIDWRVTPARAEHARGDARDHRRERRETICVLEPLSTRQRRWIGGSN